MTRIVAAAVAGLALMLLGDTAPEWRTATPTAYPATTGEVGQPVVVDEMVAAGEPRNEIASAPIIDAAMTLPAGRLQDAIREVQARIEVERAITGMANYYSDAPETRRDAGTEVRDTQAAGGALRMTDCTHSNPFPVRKHGPAERPSRPQVNRHLLDLELGPASADPLRIS